MEVVLVMFSADGGKRSFPIIHDVTIIGRREDCDLRIPLTEVSRKHCRIIKEGDSLRIEDLGSSNGSYHNGSRVQEALIQPGDQLQVGPVIFTVQIDGNPPEDEIQPPQPQEEPVEASAAGADIVTEHPVTENPEVQPEAGETTTPPANTEDGFIISVEEPEEQSDDQIISLDDPPSDNPVK